MIYFFAGMLIGAVAGVVLAAVVSAKEPYEDEITGNRSDSERLNAQEEKHKAEKQKREREQFENLMAYNGKAQK